MYKAIEPLYYQFEVPLGDQRSSERLCFVVSFLSSSHVSDTFYQEIHRWLFSSVRIVILFI